MRRIPPKTKKTTIQEDEDKLYPCSFQLILQKLTALKFTNVHVCYNLLSTCKLIYISSLLSK